MCKLHYESFLNSEQSCDLKGEVSNKTSKDTECASKFSIASITNSFNHLNGGKASGVDGLAAEHFLYADRHIRSDRLDYCNSILYNFPNNKIERLQRIQNQAARMLTRSPRRNHITPVLRELHWLRISDRIIFKILILTHKAFHGVAPVYLCELITKYEQATVRTRRAQDCFLLAIPPISKTCAASFFERSFIYAAPTLWNKLSIDIRMLEINQFKSRVKTELYLKYFEP